jgi:hypothetical protein
MAMSRRTPEDEWDEMNSRFGDGSIANASRAELERYLYALAVLRIESEVNRQKGVQRGEAIRLLLTRLDSKEVERRATTIAVTALVISIVAMFLSGVDVAVALKWINTP